MKTEVVYEDDEVEVVLSPTHEELKEMILNMLKEKGSLSAKEAHNLLEFSVSEEKIRKILDELVQEKLATYDYSLQRYVIIR